MINSFTGSYSWLSNFEPCNIIFENDRYETSEHAYQAAKTLDKNYRGIIANCVSPHLAKKMGKRIELRSDWEEVKIPIMETILREKFASGTPLAQKLLDTGDEELVEGNWWGDKFWGVCDGVGENNLGKLLMKIRNELRWMLIS